MEGDICGKTFLLLKTCQDKKLHDDFAKSCARKVYVVKQWAIIRDIQLCPKKPTPTAAENQHLIVYRKYIAIVISIFAYLLVSDR